MSFAVGLVIGVIVGMVLGIIGLARLFSAG